MKTVGIICEYNPFHTGHLHQINLAKKDGDTAVICLMSGNATQRGEFALTDKFTRAAAALSSGADLVLELPFPYSASSADYFASAGVTLLDSLGVDEINFGSESADAEALRAAAEVTSSAKFASAYEKKLEDHPALGTARAYFDTLADLGLGGSISPNDILGISYFRAAYRSDCDAKLTVIRREGDGYNSSVSSGKSHPSATAIRASLKKGDRSALSLMPPAAAKILEGAPLTDPERISSAVLSFFRLADGEELSRFAEAGGGLSHRLCAAAQKATSLEEFYAEAASKRYTDARVRRAALNCLLTVTPDDLRTPPAYLQLLAANSRGRKILAGLKKSSALPIVTKPADAPECRQTELSRRLDALFTLAFSPSKSAAEYIKTTPFIDFSEKD